MNPKLIKRLSNYALISAPLLSFYGVIPFYIFKVFPLKICAAIFVGLIVNILFYWIIDSLTILKYKKHWGWTYLLTFVGTLILRLPSFYFETPYGEIRNVMKEYFLYPFSMTLAINTIIIIIIQLIKRQEEKKLAETKISNLQIENLTAQKQVLLQQLQPHFLFNALSVLKSLIFENAKLAETYLIKLSEFLRYSLESQNQEIVTVEEELEFVNNYIGLQKIRFENAFNFTIKVEDEMLKKSVPVLSLQTLVENSFKHNYFTESNPMEITIENVDGYLKVSNSINELKHAKRVGIGLKNLKKRFQLIGHKEIKISTNENYFIAEIPTI